MKPSIKGVKARRFLSFHGHIGKVNSRIDGSSIKWNQWKALHNAIKDHTDDGESRNKKAEVWEALDKVFLYCERKNWTEHDLKEYKQVLNSFKKAMTQAWTDNHITHYMVRTIQTFLAQKNELPIKNNFFSFPLFAAYII